MPDSFRRSAFRGFFHNRQEEKRDDYDFAREDTVSPTTVFKAETRRSRNSNRNTQSVNIKGPVQADEIVRSLILGEPFSIVTNNGIKVTGKKRQRL